MTNYNHNPSSEQRDIWSKEQNKLSALLDTQDNLGFELSDLKYVAGVDLSFPLGEYENAVACLVVMCIPELKIVYKQFLQTKLHLPYIAGYLAFREVDPLLNLLLQLKKEQPELYPQIILVDGNGLLHPRKFGIASHLGVLSDTPTIGVAKNFLAIPSEFDDLNEIKKAYKSKLLKKGDIYTLIGSATQSVYGAAVRTSDSAPNPVFISQGHRVSLSTAIKIVLATCPKYRIPEPIRAADSESRAYIRLNRCLFNK